MLIDDLITDGAPGSGCDIECLMPALRRAQKFTLSPEFAAVADTLASDYTGLVRAFEHCRLPYASTWIELVQADRPLFFAAPIQAPIFQVPPKRIGFLLTATRDDLSAWKAHLFWKTDKGCSCPALAMDFDMLSEIDDCQEIPNDEDARRHYDTSPVLRGGLTTTHPGWSHAADSVKRAMLNHVSPTRTDYAPPLPIGIPPHKFQEFYETIRDLSRSDWAGEPAYLLAVICLLNARNAIEVDTSDHRKLNHARAKRGKPALFEYKTLKIAHRQKLRVDGANGPHNNYEPMRGHFVRGHFKTRKSGVYFWHPHARGSFERGAIDKEYRL